MWNFAASLPEGGLASWYRLLTYLTLGVPIAGALVGGLCGWGAFLVNDRISELQSEHQSEQVSQLTARAENAERGVSDTYDFNGAHRQNLGGGHMSVVGGPEMTVFQLIMRLNNDRDWTQLKDVCDKQISATPKWLTPYLFSGISSANLGSFADAKTRLQFVVEKAADDPHYADAARILAEIKSRTGD